jgi:hypothetical protein
MEFRSIHKEETRPPSLALGARWGDVYRALQALNLAVPGGVMDRIGVGDFLLRGK